MPPPFDISGLRPLPEIDDASATPQRSTGFDVSDLRPLSAKPEGEEADAPGLLSQAGTYLKEGGKGVVRGAANISGSVLKFGAAAQTAAAKDALRYVRQNLEVQDRIDRGEPIDPSEDTYGYAEMPPAQRQATRQRLTSRLTQFDLPGGPTERDAYKAGDFVQQAGRRAAPAAPGWEDSTTAALGEGVGSVIAGLPIMAAGPGAAAVAYGAAGGGEALDRAVQSGASTDDQMRAALLGIGPGATDVAPIELLLSRNPYLTPFKRPLANAIARIGGQAFIEGIQEGGQQFLQNLIAREVYRPEQSLTEGVVPNTGLGAGVGGIAGTGAEIVRLLAGGRHRSGQTGPSQTEDDGRSITLEDGPVSADDNMAFRQFWQSESNLRPPWAQLREPDLALTARGQRLAYADSGEAPSKPRRYVPKTPLEVSAERLTKSVSAYHDELAAGGASPEQIASGLSQTFGIEVFPEALASGNVWWAVPTRGNIEPTEAIVPSRIASPDLTDEQRAAITSMVQSEGVDAREVARRLSLPVAKVAAVVQAAKPRDARSRLNATENLFTHPDLEGMTAREAAEHVSRIQGQPVTERAIYGARRSAAEKGAELPRMGGRSESAWTDGAVAAMRAAESEGLKAPAIAERLNAQFPAFDGKLTANAIRLRRSKLARGMTAGGRKAGNEPQFAVGGEDIDTGKEDLLRELAAAEDPSAIDTSLRPVAAGAVNTRRAGSARPINWESAAVQELLEGGGRAPSSRGDFPWPPRALQMLRAAEGKGVSFTDTAQQISNAFGQKVTRDQVAAKVRRLRELGSRRDEPMLAASHDPEGWLARFRRGRDAGSAEPSAQRSDLDQARGAVSEGAPGAGAAAGAGAGRGAAGRAAGSVEGFSLGRFRGLAVETPSVTGGLRQRRYYLYPENAEVPSLGRSPQVVLRVARSSRNWVAKAHLIETEQGWQVIGVNVRKNRQRRGIGSQLYDALEHHLDADLGPSRSMSRKLFHFWEKRNAAAVAAYQRIGDQYHSPAALRSMKRVNDELLRNPPTARDAAFAKRFAPLLDAAVAKAEGLTDWAMSDVDGRRHVAAFVRAGRTVTIPEPVVARMLEAIEKSQHRLPAGTPAGALTRIEPLSGEPSYPGADVVATFRQPNGETFEVELPMRLLASARALYDNFTGAIGLARFGLFSGLDQSIAGEIHHEAMHALRRKGVLRGPLWDRLVRHAHGLRLLDGSLATYLKMVGDPAAAKANPELTLRAAYERAYKYTTDLDERIDQEAVAHMAELYSHGQLLPQEIEPVRDLLDALMSGAVPRIERAQSDGNSDNRAQHLAISGDAGAITTPGGEMQVETAPQVVELAELRPATGDLQPRDRSRAESAVGVRERASRLDPARLMPERVSDSGAPIITEDGTILSGNGRVLSIAEVYRDPELREIAEAYRRAVIAHADMIGAGDEVRAMTHPVLVSRLTEDLSEDELVQFADLSNRSSIAQMSAPERALRDARTVGPEAMGLYRGGDFTSLENREFYRAFMDAAVTANERGTISRDGVLTKEGEDRMAAAVLAAAYGDPALLSRILESTDDNIRSVTGAMRDAAGGFVRLKEAIAAGEVDPAFDITPQLAEAARRIADLRARRVSLQAFMAQQDAFSRLDPIVEDLLRGFHNDTLTRAHSREKLTELLASYAEEAAKHKQSGLIPDETRPADVVRYARQRAARSFDDLVADGTGLVRRSHGGAGRADQGPPPQRGGSAAGQAAQPPGVATPPSVRQAPAGGPPGGTVPPLIPRAPRGPAQPPNPVTLRAIGGWRTALLEFFQNSEERMHRLVDRLGQGRLPDTADPYLKATLYHGRVGTRVRYGNEIAEGIISDIADLARASRVSHEDMRALVNDYLISRHAPERNALHGDGAAGITMADARAQLARIGGRADGPRIAAIADRVATLHAQSLDALSNAGVISQQTHTDLRTVYAHHVPLNRILPDAADVSGAIAGRGFDVYSSGIKRAKGSDLEVNDILGNVLSNFEQAMIRSEKNLVDLSTLEFVRRHRQDLTGIAEEMRPPIIGTRSNGQPIFQQSNDPRVLHLFENGRPVLVRFTDARLAAAFKATNRESLPTVMRWVASVTRFYSGLQTRFNPEFAFPNKLRDLQETAVYLASRREIGAHGAARMLARDPGSTKAILDFLAGRNTPGARLYQEMLNAGGTTGGMGLSTRDQVTLNIGSLDRLAQSSPRRFARRVVALVDNWNTIFEDSTRLSVYRQARAQGLSRGRAAFLAKEASINFNRMGTAGPVINGLYMFANASIQGSVKMIRSLRNPRVAAGVGLLVAASVVAISEWNDDIDPDWRDKVSKWDRLNSLPIVLPNEQGEGIRYVSIPVSWGLKPLMVAAATAYDAAKGHAVEWSTALADIATSMIEAYNPVGGTDLGQAVTPTIGDTPLDIARNRSWTGGPIRPDQDPNLPADKQYFLKMKDTKSGRAAIKSTEALHDYTGVELSPADLSYAIEQYIGGAGRSARKTLDTLIGVGTGAPPPADEFPMLSRFYRERSQEEIGRGAGGASEDVTGHLREQSRDRFDRRSRIDDIVRSMESLSPGHKQEQLRALAKQDRQLFLDVKELVDAKARGLTWQERQVLRLGVSERAAYIADELRPLPPSERTPHLAELRRKKILTPEVMRQVHRLLGAGPAQPPAFRGLQPLAPP